MCVRVELDVSILENICGNFLLSNSLLLVFILFCVQCMSSSSIVYERRNMQYKSETCVRAHFSHCTHTTCKQVFHFSFIYYHRISRIDIAFAKRIDHWILSGSGSGSGRDMRHNNNIVEWIWRLFRLFGRFCLIVVEAVVPIHSARQCECVALVRRRVNVLPETT